MAQYNSNYTGAKIDEAIGRVLNGVSSLDILLGAYLEDTDGILYTSNAWNSSKTANAVVIITNKVRLRLALTYSSEATMMANTNTNTGYLLPSYALPLALKDFNGKLNTAIIYGIHLKRNETGSDYAAVYAYSFTFPNGDNNGYIPSVGQWDEMLKYVTLIDSCLSTVSGDPLPKSTSTWVSHTWASTASSASSSYDMFYWVMFDETTNEPSYVAYAGYRGLQGYSTKTRVCNDYENDIILLISLLNGSSTSYKFNGYNYVKI